MSRRAPLRTTMPPAAVMVFPAIAVRRLANNVAAYALKCACTRGPVGIYRVAVGRSSQFRRAKSPQDRHASIEFQAGFLRDLDVERDLAADHRIHFGWR